jgi:DUF971 family protein
LDIPVEIERGNGTEVTITWSDGRIDHVSALTLRRACPCAACQGAAAALPGTTVGRVRAVGGYAIALAFLPDGHSTGIYTFELLRALGRDAA